MGRAKYFCFLVNPQIGCMVIAMIEILWYLLNLYLCFSILFVGFKKHVLRIDYYTQTSVNLDEMTQAALGISAAVGSMICSSFLLIASFNRGSHQPLVVVYCIKNLAIFGFAIYSVVKLGFRHKEDLGTVIEDDLNIFLTCIFEIVLAAYFTMIAVFYGLETVKEPKEENVKKIHKPKLEEV